MDPLTMVGALASAVQLLDVSLSYSSHVCSFISALKHTKEDALLLRKSKICCLLHLSRSFDG